MKPDPTHLDGIPPDAARLLNILRTLKAMQRTPGGREDARLLIEHCERQGDPLAAFLRGLRDYLAERHPVQ